MKKESIVSREEALLSARKATLERIRHDISFEYYEGIIAFHAKTLNLSSGFKSSILLDHPIVVFLRNNYNESFENIFWEEKDIFSIISFDDLSKFEEPEHEEFFDLWIQEDIENAFRMIDEEQVQQTVLCYFEGKNKHSQRWLHHFRNRLNKGE